MIRCRFMGGACLVLLVLASILGDAKPYEPATEEPKLAVPDVPLTYSNSKRIRIKYECKDLGPSGITNVELWLTQDGKQWQPVSASHITDVMSPIIFNADKDGRYGFRVVVHGGGGHLGNQPKPDDVPQWWVEIDTTKPAVHFLPSILGRGQQAGKVILRWSASDKNLTEKPISLYFSEKRDGPWTTIAENIANAGSHEWLYPKEAPLRVFFRVRAVDRAGNVSMCNTDIPLVLDPAEPRAVITGIEPVLENTPKPPVQLPDPPPPPK